MYLQNPIIKKGENVEQKILKYVFTIYNISSSYFGEFLVWLVNTEYIYLYRYLPIIEVWRSLHSRTLQYQMVSSNQLCDRPSSILQSSSIPSFQVSSPLPPPAAWDVSWPGSSVWRTRPVTRSSRSYRGSAASSWVRQRFIHLDRILQGLTLMLHQLFCDVVPLTNTQTVSGTTSQTN